jgi:glycosyltransferase involved in cell wall biosynthesis
MLVRNNGVRRKKIDVVGEGIDLKEYNPNVNGNAFREEFGIPANVPLVGIIGMMRSDKGHHYFLDGAFEILEKESNIHFVMVGEGTKDREIEKQLRERIAAHPKKKQIIMTGYRWDIPNVIASLDVLVVASTGVEAQSRVVPQAFATRRAVIATQTGGIPELVHDGENGLVVPPGNGHALAEAIQKLVGNEELRMRLAKHGYDKARNELSISRMMELTLRTYRKAIRHGGDDS